MSAKIDKLQKKYEETHDMVLGRMVNIGDNDGIELVKEISFNLHAGIQQALNDESLADLYKEQIAELEKLYNEPKPKEPTPDLTKGDDFEDVEPEINTQRIINQLQNKAGKEQVETMLGGVENTLGMVTTMTSLVFELAKQISRNTERSLKKEIKLLNEQIKELKEQQAVDNSQHVDNFVENLPTLEPDELDEPGDDMQEITRAIYNVRED